MWPRRVSSGSPTRGSVPAARADPRRSRGGRQPPQVNPASKPDLDVLMQGLLKLPRRDGYPPWYPADVVARAR